MLISIFYSGTQQDKRDSELLPAATIEVLILYPLFITILGAQGIIIVYDVTDRESFDNVRQWMHEIERYKLFQLIYCHHRFANQGVCKILVGNKCDLEENRKVSFEEGMELSKHYEIPFLETSAKNSVNVESSFITMSKEIKRNI